MMPSGERGNKDKRHAADASAICAMSAYDSSMAEVLDGGKDCTTDNPISMIMATGQKQVMDIKPGKGMAVNESNEHQRKWNDHTKEVQMGRREYDPTRDHLNFEIVKGGKVQSIDKSKTIPQRMAERLAVLGIKDPNEGKEEPTRNTLAKIIFSGNHDRMVELAFGTQDVDLTRQKDNSHIQRMPEIEQWSLDMYRFACEQWGEDDIVGFYVHLDEKCPHIHCTVLPVTPQGKLSHKKVFHGESKDAMAKHLAFLHDELAKINAKWGLERGSDIRKTGAKHCPPEEYRRKLAQELDELVRKVEAHEMTLDEMKKQIRTAEIKLKSFNTMIARLTARQEELTRQRDDLIKEYNHADADKAHLESEIAEREQELENVKTKITNRQMQLSVTQQELDVLKGEVEKSKEQVHEMDEQLGKMSGDYARQMELRLKAVAMDEMVSTVHDMITHSPFPQVQTALDRTLAKEFALRFNDIVRCAILLSVGLVDQATTFAEGHGGGGSDMPWGRKDDEDERMWLMRCLMQGARMMHPRSSQQKKR